MTMPGLRLTNAANWGQSELSARFLQKLHSDPRWLLPPDAGGMQLQHQNFPYLNRRDLPCGSYCIAGFHCRFWIPGDANRLYCDIPMIFRAACANASGEQSWHDKCFVVFD